jgi:hypothetical protein
MARPLNAIFIQFLNKYVPSAPGLFEKGPGARLFIDECDDFGKRIPQGPLTERP